mmetsp:Transcript_64769/g.163038  ORF Transcript_64769/g.163038 Transcript_64769/m.163038 type:complete len:427 (+) Transcript_64769:69-1349(+)
MFVPHSDLSIWGLKEESGIELMGMTTDKPLASSAADDEERGLADSHAPSDTDPWKVHIPGLEEEKPSQRISDETTGWDSMLAGATDDPEQYLEQYSETLGSGWWPDTDTWANPLNWLQHGDIVCFHGLQQTTLLNGMCATVEGWDEATGRWSVRLASGVEKFAKPENLAVVQAQAFPAAAAACFAAGGVDPNVPTPWWCSTAGTRQRARTAKKGVDCRTSSFASDTTTASGSSRSAVSSFSADEGGDTNNTEDPSQPWTTVMMRNIPNDYTGTMLLDLLNERGFEGLYNLVYLPMDYHRKAGFGYAFIDFLSTEEAQRFRETFEGFSDWGLVSHKICNVSWSDALQGVQAHIDRYRNSPVMHDAVPDEFKPMLFENGQRVPFPAPTKSIRAPRLRKKDPRQPVQPQQQHQRQSPGLQQREQRRHVA